MTGEAAPAGRSLASRSNALLAGALVLLVVCAGFATWFGLSWYNASGDAESEGYSQNRDQVRQIGVGAIENFTTLDYKHPDEWVRGVAQFTTGQLKDDLTSRENRYKQVMVSSKAVLRGKVLDSAVTSLDLREGNAEMIAAVDTASSSAKKGKPSTQRLWLQLELRQADGGWKVANLLGAPGITTPG